MNDRKFVASMYSSAPSGLYLPDSPTSSATPKSLFLSQSNLQLPSSPELEERGDCMPPHLIKGMEIMEGPPLTRRSRSPSSDSSKSNEPKSLLAPLGRMSHGVDSDEDEDSEKDQFFASSPVRRKPPTTLARSSSLNAMNHHHRSGPPATVTTGGTAETGVGRTNRPHHKKPAKQCLHSSISNFSSLVSEILLEPGHAGTGAAKSNRPRLPKQRSGRKVASRGRDRTARSRHHHSHSNHGSSGDDNGGGSSGTDSSLTRSSGYSSTLVDILGEYQAPGLQPPPAPLPRTALRSGSFSSSSLSDKEGSPAPDQAHRPTAGRTKSVTFAPDDDDCSDLTDPPGVSDDAPVRLGDTDEVGVLPSPPVEVVEENPPSVRESHATPPIVVATSPVAPADLVAPARASSSSPPPMSFAEQNAANAVDGKMGGSQRDFLLFNDQDDDDDDDDEYEDNYRVDSINPMRLAVRTLSASLRKDDGDSFMTLGREEKDDTARVSSTPTATIPTEVVHSATSEKEQSIISHQDLACKESGPKTTVALDPLVLFDPVEKLSTESTSLDIMNEATPVDAESAACDHDTSPEDAKEHQMAHPEAVIETFPIIEAVSEADVESKKGTIDHGVRREAIPERRIEKICDLNVTESRVFSPSEQIRDGAHNPILKSPPPEPQGSPSPASPLEKPVQIVASNVQEAHPPTNDEVNLSSPSHSYSRVPRYGVDGKVEYVAQPDSNNFRPIEKPKPTVPNPRPDAGSQDAVRLIAQNSTSVTQNASNSAFQRPRRPVQKNGDGEILSSPTQAGQSQQRYRQPPVHTDQLRRQPHHNQQQHRQSQQQSGNSPNRVTIHQTQGQHPVLESPDRVPISTRSKSVPPKRNGNAPLRSPNSPRGRERVYQPPFSPPLTGDTRHQSMQAHHQSMQARYQDKPRPNAPTARGRQPGPVPQGKFPVHIPPHNSMRRDHEHSRSNTRDYTPHASSSRDYQQPMPNREYYPQVSNHLDYQYQAPIRHDVNRGRAPEYGQDSRGHYRHHPGHGDGNLRQSHSREIEGHEADRRRYHRAPPPPQGHPSSPQRYPMTFQPNHRSQERPSSRQSEPLHRQRSVSPSRHRSQRVGHVHSHRPDVCSDRPRHSRQSSNKTHRQRSLSPPRQRTSIPALLSPRRQDPLEPKIVQVQHAAPAMVPEPERSQHNRRGRWLGSVVGGAKK